MDIQPKHAGGRPPLWTDPEVLQCLVDDYFKIDTKPTLSGLALHLGIERKTLYNYETKDEFLHIIKKARQKVEAIYEERAVYDDKPTGVIFALKNMGWSDNQKIDHTTAGEPITEQIDYSKLSDDALREIALARRGSAKSG
jgi:hypothetical protein